MSSDPPRSGTDGWDRIGEFMSRMNETGAVMAQRNLDAWTEISADLRDPKFTADAWARSNAKLFGTLLDNAQEMATLLGTSPGNQPAANVIPTVFLLFVIEIPDDDGADDASKRKLVRDPFPDVPPIDAPRWISRCPPRASLWLAGGTGDDDAVAVRKSITIARDKKNLRRYNVTYKSRKATKQLPLGSYSGVSYLELGTTYVPLADVRVVVRRADTD
ncbi:hypothetical protein OJ997_04305 [Solirubrobacter phytolaccae]|uniref:Uncharacterized protein n=1 Tax=Solirubrobacter phytolaccae TaxID=1404360 RepID=A0A9X3S6T8_9ACTN|nr:hypothetical protein [Solirubrobacter phytolaccae]MDA0179508.1 hypothetical protein [Solirubrobacter phytolaccae]